MTNIKMKTFITAIQFLTVLPVGKNKFDESSLPRAARYFPAAGLLLGLILAALYFIFSALKLNILATSTVIVVSLVALTGGLHMDGLSDTFDGLLSSKGKEEMLAIMRDPHTGAMGTIAIISAMLLKIVFLFSLPPAQVPASLILMCSISRGALVPLMLVFPYARSEGKGKVFIAGMNRKIVYASVALSFIIALVFGKTRGILIMAAAFLAAYLFSVFISKKIGGITGDTLGAANEISEIAILFCISLLNGVTL